MPYNCFGDLHKYEVVEKLNEMGCHIKSVNTLNKTLEQMGILIHIGSDWKTTEKGSKFTPLGVQVINADAWHPSIVTEVFKFVSNK